MMKPAYIALSPVNGPIADSTATVAATSLSSTSLGSATAATTMAALATSPILGLSSGAIATRPSAIKSAATSGQPADTPLARRNRGIVQRLLRPNSGECCVMSIPCLHISIDSSSSPQQQQQQQQQHGASGALLPGLAAIVTAPSLAHDVPETAVFFLSSSHERSTIVQSVLPITSSTSFNIVQTRTTSPIVAPSESALIEAMSDELGTSITSNASEVPSIAQSLSGITVTPASPQLKQQQQQQQQQQQKQQQQSPSRSVGTGTDIAEQLSKLADFVLRIHTDAAEMTLSFESMADLQKFIQILRVHIQAAQCDAIFDALGPTHSWLSYYRTEVSPVAVESPGSPSAVAVTPPAAPVAVNPIRNSLDSIITRLHGKSIFDIDLDDLGELNTNRPMATPVTDLFDLAADPTGAMGRDSASDDIALSRDVRDAFILRELHLRSSAEFIESGSLRIVAGTWNVNGRPATESLRTWLRPRPVPPPTSEPVSPSIAPTDQIHTDLYVVGLQEVDLSKEAYLVLDSTKEQEWSRAIELAINSSSLPQHPQYRKVASKQLIGMLVLVYARLEIADDIHDIRVDSVGTGIMGIMGNKGGVAIRLMYQFTTMCFVNSHLAHDVTQIERRNQDYMDICRRMTFNDRYQQNDTVNIQPTPKTEQPPPPPPPPPLASSPATELSQATPEETYSREGDTLIKAPEIEPKRDISSEIKAATVERTRFSSPHQYARATSIYHLSSDPFASLLRGIEFPVPSATAVVSKRSANASSQASIDPSVTRASTIFEADAVLWIGDLNYRVPLTDERVRMTLLGGQYDVLLEHDQLRTVQKEGQAFADFREGEIRFPPTFKYEIGSHALDEKRVPSWCDRVLWWTRQPSSIEAPSTGIVPTSEKIDEMVSLRSYYSPTSSYSLSDHKPVAAVFDVNVKCFNKQKYTETHDALVREFDRLESTCVPAAVLVVKDASGSRDVDLGTVRIGEFVSKAVTLQNTGFVPLRFAVSQMSQNGNNTALQTWAVPSVGTLMPGASVDLSITTLVDPRIVNMAESTVFDMMEPNGLNTTLIVHIRRGSQLFIPVNGQLEKSCFGLPLDVLTSNQTPVRETEVSVLKMAKQSAHHRSLPVELWKLTDFIMQQMNKFNESPAAESTAAVPPTMTATGAETTSDTHSIETVIALPQLFTSRGDPACVQVIRECLDTGADISPQCASAGFDSTTAMLSAAETLVRFFAFLPQPLIPREQLAGCLLSVSGPTAVSAADAHLLNQADTIPHHCMNVFMYTMAFLQMVCQKGFGDRNRVAALFAHVLLRVSRLPASAIDTTPYMETVRLQQLQQQQQAQQAQAQAQQTSGRRDNRFMSIPSATPTDGRDLASSLSPTIQTPVTATFPADSDTNESTSTASIVAATLSAENLAKLDPVTTARLATDFIKQFLGKNSS